MKDKAMAMDALEQVSGGKFEDYVKVTDVIHKRMKELGGGQNCTRLTEKDAAGWLKDNLNIGAEFFKHPVEPFERILALVITEADILAVALPGRLMVNDKEVHTHIVIEFRHKFIFAVAGASVAV